VVDEFGGYLPLKVEGVSEGGVVYPGEPFLRVQATAPGFGPLVPWFESTLLHVWSASERLTAARHFLRWAFELIRSWEPPSVTDDQCMFFARLMIHDFGDRAAACPQESELVAKVHNYVFFGTDTFRAAYQNWKNGAPPAFGSSVKALAHRIVQGFEREFDCYETMYASAENNEFLSMVGDCYDYWYALENKLIPLALRAKADGSGKVVVARPDSGDSVDMVVGTLERAKNAGLMQTVASTHGPMLASTTLRFIVGNGETYQTVRDVLEACLKAGFLPWRCGIFGVGGHLRNNINRDHMSTKFALCAVGNDNRPVIKLSMEPGKQTLPLTKVLRDKTSLESGVAMLRSAPGSPTTSLPARRGLSVDLLRCPSLQVGGPRA
jgi:nicotinic acid phosphoribosyltransferase